MASYIFIDESGDPGKLVDDASNSRCYSELALQVSNLNINTLYEHLINWRYVKRISREVKSLPNGVDKKRFIEPIAIMQESGVIKCSCIYVDKTNYKGPYLNNAQPLKFRNYIHRNLLEHHFSKYPSITDENIELVFDRFEMSKEEIQNMENYLTKNWNLPNFKYITHVDSIYCEILQLTSQLVNMIKDLKSDKTDQEFKNRMHCIPIKEL
jgi:hypothetical protein